MAQEIGYMENDVEFKEGPFVISNPLQNGWRIEVELKGHRCPVLPDRTIYKLKKKEFGMVCKTSVKRQIVEVCDFLNQMVVEGEIVLEDKAWVWIGEN